MNSVVKPALLVILILNQLILIAQGQTKDWHVYSSSEDQFTIAVPRAVKISRTAESKNEANLEPTQKESLNSYVSVYEDTVGSDEESKFRVLVINAKAKMFNSMSRDDLLTYFSVMMIGDDDDPQPSSERVIKVNGLNGKEYVWANEGKVFADGRSPELFTRGRVFDRRDKIYVIVFRGESAGELKSQVAERFLNSFRLNR